MNVDCFDDASGSIALAGLPCDALTPPASSHSIDDLIEELAALAASEIPVAGFHERLLTAAIRQASASGGAIWLRRQCAIERLPAGLTTEAGGPATSDRLQLIDRVVHLKQPLKAPLECITAGSTVRYIVALAPVAIEQTPEGAIELLLPGAASRSEQDRAVSLAAAFAEVLADFHRRGLLDYYRARERQSSAALEFSSQIHRTRLTETAVAIVNEGRWFVACDRASLFSTHNGRCTLLAVSGIDQVDRRASINRRMREVAETAIKTNERLWATGEPHTSAPQIEQCLQAFLDESHAAAAVVVPLSEPVEHHARADAPAAEIAGRQPRAVLVLEWFAMPQLDSAERERIDIVATHAAAAVAIAQATDELPLICVNRALGQLRWLTQARQLPKTLWGLASIALLIIALVAVPAELEVAAEGELLPAVRREIFAPADGVVDLVLVEHGDQVTRGQPLLRLRSPALDFEQAKIGGEIETAEKQLAAIQAARFERDSAAETAGVRHLRLSAEEETLKLKLRSLRQQADLVAAQLAELEISAPFAGCVLTWDAARSLKARPVKRGQALLSIGDVAGPWEVDLQVPDDHIGYVLEARSAREDQQELPVSFLLLADPAVEYRGQVKQIALRSVVALDRGEAFVRVTVRPDEPVINPRPGAGVAGHIQCGRRSLGFVWLHDAWNSLQRRILF